MPSCPAVGQYLNRRSPLQALWKVLSVANVQSQSRTYCTSTPEAQPHQDICRFASAYSDKPTLAQAVVECIGLVKAQLGSETRLDLCQLLVTLGHGEHLRLAPMVRGMHMKFHIWMQITLLATSCSIVTLVMGALTCVHLLLLHTPGSRFGFAGPGPQGACHAGFDV